MCLTLWPMGYSPPGFSLHGRLQARILEWVAIPFSVGSSRIRNQTWVSCTVGRFFTLWAIRESDYWVWINHSKENRVEGDYQSWALVLSSSSTFVTLLLIAWPWKSHVTYLSLNSVIRKMEIAWILTTIVIGAIIICYTLKCHTGVRETYHHMYSPSCWEIPGGLAPTLEGLAVHCGRLEMGLILS